MSEKVYRVVWGKWRPKFSIAFKTLLSFLLIISFLAGGFYYFTTNTISSQIEKEALGDLKSHLKGASKLFSMRLDQMKFGMLQAGSQDSVKYIIEKKDGHRLQELLNGFSSSRPYVDLWAIVDPEGKVIGRRNGQTGDFLDIHGIVLSALETGDPVTSTESVSRDILEAEDTALASKVEMNGVMQLAVTPVKSRGRIIGAFVTGILLNKNDWLPNSIYENFNVTSAVLAGIDDDPRVISSSLMPKSAFNPLTSFPDSIRKSLKEKKMFLGPAEIEGSEIYLAVAPIYDSQGKLIAGLALGTYSSDVKRNVVRMKEYITKVALIGVVFSILLAGITFRDTTKPIKAITGAMEETARGNLDVRMELKTRDDFEQIGRGFNQMINSIQVREDRLDRFNEISKILIEAKDPEELLNKALTRMVELTGSNIGVVYLHDEKSEVLRPLVSYGINESELKKLKVGEGLAGKCASERKTIALQNITEANISLETGFSRILPTSLVWFAMNYKDKLNGVFVLGGLQPYKTDEIKHMEHLVRQITIALDNALIHKEIERLSLTDPLTNLNNRRYFIELLENEFKGARRYRYNLAVLMIDIDHFKSINDTFGHLQGDKILLEVSNLIRASTRATDVWARYGGEEFIGLITHCSPDGILVVAEKIRKSIEAYEFPGMGGKQVTVSVGVGLYPHGEVKDIDDLIKIADDNLYRAKKAGRNQVVAQIEIPEGLKVVKG